MRKVILVVIGLMVIVALVACSQKAAPKFVTDGNYTYEVFRPLYDSLVESVDVARLCQEFIENSDDIELARRIENYWMRMDQAGAGEAMHKLSIDNPTSTKYLYLYGRTVEDPMEQLEIGRKLIGMDKSFPYGYRLVTAVYTSELFDGDPSSEVYTSLQASLADDAHYITDGVQESPDDVYFHQVLVDYDLFEKKYTDALAALDAGKALNSDRWPTPMDYAVVYASQGDFKKTKATVEEQFKDFKDKPDYKDNIENAYFSVLTKAKAYDEIIKVTKSMKGYGKDPNMLYNLACTYSLKGDVKDGIASLANAAKAGWQEVAHTKRDSDLDNLHESADWDATVAMIQKNWDDGKDDRMAEVLASKINEPAPMWELEDENGKIVKLADMKGNVVILDFWATWCGPCKMAMPVIDEFLKTEAPENVKIFSVNVWEKGRQNPVKFMKEHEYAMKLVYGNDDVVQQYGFNGIPFLCVIDKDGNIRYKHIGYTDGLKENLEFWVNDLI